MNREVLGSGDSIYVVIAWEDQCFHNERPTGLCGRGGWRASNSQNTGVIPVPFKLQVQRTAPCGLLWGKLTPPYGTARDRHPPDEALSHLPSAGGDLTFTDRNKDLAKHFKADSQIYSCFW